MIFYQYRRQAGFSLLELVVTFVIILITALFSVQGFADFFEHRKQRIFMQQLYHDLKWARVEAIVLNVPVAMQPYNDQLNVITTTWCDGWVIFKNSDNNGLKKSAQILKTHSGLQDCHITFSSFPELVYFQFLPEGASDYQNGTFRFYDQSKVSMEIIVNQTGRVRWVS